MKNDDDFLQKAYSDKGYTVQYKENGKQFETKNYLSKEETIQLFKLNYQSDSSCKEEISWQIFEYYLNK